MANELKPTGANGDQAKSIDLVRQFVENQTKELEHRGQQLELDKQKDEHAFQFGKEALATQERDRKHERECAREQRKDRDRFVLYIALIIAGLLFGSIAFGQPEIALELAKYIGTLLAGALGGYGYAKIKSKDSDD